MPDMPMTDLSDTDVMVVARLTLAAKEVQTAVRAMGVELNRSQLVALAMAAVRGWTRLDSPGFTRYLIHPEEGS